MSENTNHPCWLDSNISCECKNKESCIEFFKKYAKVVYCNDHSCIWNMHIDLQKEIKQHTLQESFEGDNFRGVCSRPEIGLILKNIETTHLKYKMSICSVRSDKQFTDKTDFTKFDGSYDRQNRENVIVYDDPIDPTSVFH